jgi:hypothetical protein
VYLPVGRNRMKTKQSKATKSNSDRLVIKESRGVFLVKGLTIVLVLGILLYGILNQYQSLVSLLQVRFLGLLLLLLALIGLALYCFWKVSNPTTVAILHKEGIWIKKKGLLAWEDIVEYGSKYRYNKYWSVSEVYLWTKNKQKITLDLSLTDISVEAVEWYLQRLTKKR